MDLGPGSRNSLDSEFQIHITPVRRIRRPFGGSGYSYYKNVLKNFYLKVPVPVFILLGT